MKLFTTLILVFAAIFFTSCGGDSHDGHDHSKDGSHEGHNHADGEEHDHSEDEGHEEKK